MENVTADPHAWRHAGFKIDPSRHPEIGRRYEAGESSLQLAADLGMTSSGVRRILKSLGVRLRDTRTAGRKRALNETVFDNPGEDGRYWIGFLMADGCVQRSKTHDSWSITLVASEKDATHIEKFRTFLGTESEVQRKPASEPRLMPGGYYSVSKPHVRLSVTSKPLAETLGRYGVIPRKSLVAKVIGLEMCPHFWRGAVDGDGMVTWHNNPSGPLPLIGLCGSHELVRQFEAFAKSVSPDIDATTRPNSTGRISVLRVVGRPAVPLIQALYGGCTVGLARKWETARDILSRDWSEPEPRVCEIPGCGKPHVGQGYCSAHWHRLNRHGDPLGGAKSRNPNPPDVCSVPGCGLPHRSLGYCNTHMLRFKRHGSPDVTLRERRGTVCTVPGCGRAQHSRGLCGLHYQQARKRVAKACSVADCGRPQSAKGLCSLHYQRAKR